MKEKAEQSERFAQIGHDVLEEYEDLHELRGQVYGGDVTIGYMTSDKKKKSQGKAVFGECRKVPDYYKCFIPYDFLITVYETNTTLFRFTDEQYHILLYHELQHVGVEYNQDGEPCYSVRPHDVEEFRSVIEKHGIDWAINETFKRRSTLADGIYDTGEN